MKSRKVEKDVGKTQQKCRGKEEWEVVRGRMNLGSSEEKRLSS